MGQSPSQPLLGSSRNTPPQTGALRDDPNNGCEGDYGDPSLVEKGELGDRYYY